MSSGLNEGNGWTVERKLLIATFVCSAIGFGFSVGFNWARLVSVQSEVEKLQAFEHAVPATYVPREVYLINQQNFTEAINRLNVTLQKIQDTQREVRK